MNCGKKQPGGQLYIVSGPSGSGKTTLCQKLLQEMPDLRFSVSFTTRSPRNNETEGVDYFFVSREQFRDMRERQAFLECAEVYGNWYGTSAEEVQKVLDGGLDVLLDIDTQGARQVRERVPEVISILIFPPSFEVLRSRLESRRQDSAEAILRRLQVARSELQCFPSYDFIIVNDEIRRAQEDLAAIVRGCRCRAAWRGAQARSILTGFAEMGADA